MGVGRKKAPTELKVLRGTARADRMNPNAPSAAAEALCAPAGLPAAALPHFETLRGMLAGIGLDSATYAQVMGMAARRMAEVAACDAFLDDMGGTTYETKTAKDGYMVRAYPQVAHRSEALRHLHSLLSEMGLTPAAIGKVNAKDPSKRKEPKFQGLKRA